MSKIFVLYHPEDEYIAGIVFCAIERSFTKAQIKRLFYEDIGDLPEGAVLVNPKAEDISFFKNMASKGSKILVLGKLEKPFDKEIGLKFSGLPAESKKWVEINLDVAEPFSKSRAFIKYRKDHFLTESINLAGRYLARYDFTDEWNNLGYGRIGIDNNIWSLCNEVKENGAMPLGQILDEKSKVLSLYSAIIDTPTSATLWFNRAVGPVDSTEWNIVEKFFGDYRPDDLTCFPYISEIPFGYDGACTMRLDCDQAISSAMPLVELYDSFKIRVSLAVTTGSKISANDSQFLKSIIKKGGAVVSHSHKHLPNWGGDYDTAFNEALTSKKWLEEHIEEARPIKYAVSPFHKNSIYAVKALADAGYKGFIGGTIHNDPEFLLGRAGCVPFIEKEVVSSSQQCMFHGDCFHRYGSSIDVYKESFKNHMSAGSIFGYFDHPFSNEYQYGWKSEDERLGAHKEFINFVKKSGKILWWNLNECLDFIVRRNSAKLEVSGGKNIDIKYNKKSDRLMPPFKICWKGKVFKG